MEIENKIKRHAPKRFGAATLLHTAETGSEDWKFSRQHGIGGSEVSSIVGLNQYKSAFALWAERTGQIEPEPVDNWAVRFGRNFEAPILQMWADDNPDYEVFTTGTYSNNDYPFMQASPDALARHKETDEWIVIEVKTARSHWSETPPGYRAQVLHYLNVLGLKRAVIVAVAGWDWYEDWIDYDAFENSAIAYAVTRFWDMVQNKVAPDFDGAESTYESVRKLHPLIDPELEVEIDGAHDLVRLQDAADYATAELRKAKSEVLNLMGNAKHAYVEHDGVRYRVASRQARKDSPPFLVITKNK